MDVETEKKKPENWMRCNCGKEKGNAEGTVIHSHHRIAANGWDGNPQMGICPTLNNSDKSINFIGSLPSTTVTMVHPRPLLPYLTSPYLTSSYLTLPYLYLISWKGSN